MAIESCASLQIPTDIHGTLTAVCLASDVQPELLLPLTFLQVLGILLELVQMVYRAGGGL